MIKQLAIYGAGGFAREVAWLAEPPLLTVKKGLNPLRAGQGFRLRCFKLPDDFCENESQTPQSGARFPTAVDVGGVYHNNICLKPLRAGQGFRRGLVLVGLLLVL